MLRLAADENFNGRIVRGLLRALPDLDLVREIQLLVEASLAEEPADRVVYVPLN